ncbi:MAG: acyl--CoA ligase, partial [Sneathiella sp.]|nr:acyl--CoA ligase [Sneathiella sp.]
MNIANLLIRSAKNFPDLPALAHGTEITATYRQFSDQAAALAGALLNEYALKKGDRVALIMKNHPEYWVALFALWQAGLVAVPVNAKLHISEFDYILENSGAKLCFATSDLASALRDLKSDAKIIDISDPEYNNLKNSAPIAV